MIRLGRFEDVFAIEQTLLVAAVEAGFPVPVVEQPYAYQKTMDLIARGMVFVAEEGSRVVGVLILGTQVWAWNRQVWQYCDEYFWVEPEFRKGGTAEQLLEAAKAKAHEEGRMLWIDLSFGGADTELKDRFVKRCGFTYKGGRFLFDPSRGFLHEREGSIRSSADGSAS